MISYADALQLLLAECTALAAERCKPVDSVGRVLASNVHAADELPLFDNAAMDGFALAGDAVAGSEYQIVGMLAAGDAAPELTSTHAWEIMTGAALPTGCDRVAALEQTERTTQASVRLLHAIPAGRNLRHRGSDVAAGDLLAAAGQRMDAPLRMLLAASGVTDLQLRRRPRITLVRTGKELVDDVSQAPGQGRIHDASGPFLQAALQEFGADVVSSTTVGDDPAAFAACLQQAATSDLVITTGAVSMGQHDFVPTSLRAMGARVLFHKVAMRPGKPLLAALLPRGALLIALPGNPVATAVGFRFFVVPVLRAMLGMAQETSLRVPLSTATHGRAGLRHFLKARLQHTEASGLQLTLLPGQESFRMAPLLQANAWAILDEAGGERPAGTWVEAVPRDAVGGWQL